MRIRYWRFLWMASFWICQRGSFTWLLRWAYLPSIWCRQECWRFCLQAVLRLWTRVEVGSWNQRSESETFKVNFLLPESFECTSKKSRCWLKRSSDPWRYFNCSYISKLSYQRNKVDIKVNTNLMLLDFLHHASNIFWIFLKLYNHPQPIAHLWYCRTDLAER